MDGRENPNYLEECKLFIDHNFQVNGEYIRNRKTMHKYANYLPIIGEIETYFPGFEEDGKRSGILYDGGIYYIHRNSVAEEDLSWNLANVLWEQLPKKEDGGLLTQFEVNEDLPYEEGVRYTGGIQKGKLHIARYYVYYID